MPGVGSDSSVLSQRQITSFVKWHQKGNIMNETRLEETTERNRMKQI